MGLDLTHYKATRNPVSADDSTTFREDDFDEYALDVLGFRRFIQTIPDFDYPTRILIVKDPASLDAIRKRAPWLLKDVFEVLDGHRNLLDRVKAKEEAHGLDPHRRYIQSLMFYVDKKDGLHYYGQHWRERTKPLEEAQWGRWNQWNIDGDARRAMKIDPPKFFHHPAQAIQLCYPVPSDYRGLYAHEVGYQRKGMSAEFYDAFGSPSWHVRLADVQRAATFLGLTGEAEDDRKRQEYFASQFLVGFEEGTSIFSVSY